METAKTGTTQSAAGGQKFTNVGESRPRLKSSGTMASMAFQATNGVQEPLAAPSKIAALDDAASESYIKNKVSGVRTPLKIETGVYMVEMSVAPFQGQAT